MNSPQRAPRRRPFLNLLLVLVGLLGLSAPAFAACGQIEGSRSSAAKLPVLFGAPDELSFYNPTVVGLWHAIYTNTANNQVFNDSFKSWHSDGTEVESAFMSPSAGNVCMGVWKSTDFRSVKLHHTGWLYNPATPTATAANYFTIDEFVTVAPHGKTYTGTFTFKVWNLDGTPTPVEVKGTIAATRITV